MQVCPKNPANFNVDNVRVAKLVGGGLHNSTVVRGMVLKSDAVGSIKRVEKAKVTSNSTLNLYCHFSVMFQCSILFICLLSLVFLNERFCDCTSAAT